MVERHSLVRSAVHEEEATFRTRTRRSEVSIEPAPDCPESNMGTRTRIVAPRKTLEQLDIWSPDAPQTNAEAPGADDEMTAGRVI